LFNIVPTLIFKYIISKDRGTFAYKDIAFKFAALISVEFELYIIADLLNIALFGLTAAQWRTANPDKDGNMRDYATLEQLVVLSNMESINAMLIGQGLSQSDRLLQLNSTAIIQMKALVNTQLNERLA